MGPNDRRRPRGALSVVPAPEPASDAVALVRALFVQAYQAAAGRRTGLPSTWGDRPMPRWDGGWDGTGNHPCVWRRLADVCLRHQLDPAAFVAAQFHGLDPERPLPWPNQCCGPVALERYRAYARDSVAALATALAGQRYRLRVAAVDLIDADGLAPRDAVGVVLADADRPLSGLFRYCVAERYGYPDLADRFRESAILQYVFNRDAYHQAWGDFLPPGLAAAAARLLADGEERTHD